MKTAFLHAALAVFIVLTASSAFSGEVPDGLSRVPAVEALPLFRDETMLTASSYDRTGGNDDGFSGAYSSIRQENGEWVFFEEAGPGVIYRFWSANNHGALSVYLDGAETPAWRAPFQKFLSGNVEPLVKPLCEYVAGGLNCYFPLAFEKSIKMTLDEDPRFFQIGYAKLPNGRRVNSAAPENLANDAEAIAKAAEAMDRRGAPPAAAAAARRDPFEIELPEGAEVDVWVSGQAGTIRGLRVDASEWSARDLADVRLRMYWDGEPAPAVDAPLLRFFASDFKLEKFRTLLVGLEKSTLYSYFPMPFAKSARITLTGGGSAKRIRGEVLFETGPMEPGAGYFHASHGRTVSKSGEPILINDITGGRGHWAGTSVSVIRKSGEDDKFTYLEGDESIYVDGETVPSTHGTGTEDYFNGGWYFSSGQTFSRAFHALPLMEKARSRTVMNRLHFTDAIPFKNRLRFELEHGGGNSEPGVLYSAVGYWYQEAAGRTGVH